VGLKEYRKKRDFERTPEPAPVKESVPADADPRLYVIQKHDATNLHYDLRLRIGDTLKSWAVPKGPSLDPREKRLAVEVEDHPVGYGDFEGNIPQGEYGGGSVMVWDRGRWSPANGDPVKALKDGELKFNLEGERLKGRWVLVRTSYKGKQPQWLLIKERDSEATAGVHAETFPTSVKTGRTMDEIAANAPARDMPAAPQPTSASALSGARAASIPAKLKPQLAVPADAAPAGNDWLHEVKFDGYRLLIFRKGDSVKILSRNALDWTAKLPDIAAAVRERLRIDAVLDGEAVILDTRGVSDFQALQNAIHSRRSKSIVFIAFDLPWCDGQDLTKVPIEQRRALLEELIGNRQEGRLRFSQHIAGNGPAVLERIREHGLEGIVSKRRGTPYSQSRTPAWVKVKCFNQQEFVIGGYSEPEGAREQFGALLLGYYDQKTLRYAGRVGTGFSAETLKKLAGQLRPLLRSKPAFANPPTGPEGRGVTWVEPKLVAQIQFGDWTGDDLIRHASFRGLREDIDPATVTREPSRAPAADPPEPAQPRQVEAPRLTSPDRVVYPDRGAGYSLTKRQVAEYYEAVATHMLPYVANRPLAILRCPSGEGGKTFFQKHPAKGMPPSILGVAVPNDPEKHLLIKDEQGLMGLVQMSVLEFHPWGSLATNPDAPDRIIFDLDPGPGVAWRQIVEGAVMVRDALSQLKLRGYARTSGGKGVHVVVALKPKHTWEQVKTFCKAFADTLVKLAPTRFIATSTIKSREGRIYVDYLRNTRGATAIASYSTRARPGAPVALPVSWDELEGIESAAAFTVPSVLRRLASSAPDPWETLKMSAGTLPKFK
jgi:bifunctional non-homologous end joining protein LigD